ncbi:MAG: hypothetical protein D6832_02755 [Alphaproteobacteria bacterium]|nr:MAG: hypothetical protein D6832_02755 [Alphaproteobacteria bacterium]
MPLEPFAVASAIAAAAPLTVGAVWLALVRPVQRANAALRARLAELEARLAASRRPSEPDEQTEYLLEICDAAPMLMWRENDTGDVVWANRAYLEALRQLRPGRDRHGWPLPRLFGDLGRPEVDAGRRRCRIEAADGSEHWFDIVPAPWPRDGAVWFATDAAPLVQAEAAVRQFVAALTETFAQLGTGLAVFGADGRLSIFNPALARMTGIAPEWLSRRPDVARFLDELRRRALVPEPGDWSAWRARMARILRDARAGVFEERWSVPAGRTFRVTGRPHPEGALALMFEDVTAEITLRQRLRAELELGQAVLDRLPLAVAVFDRRGRMVLANAPLRRLWALGEDEPLEPPALAEVLRRMARQLASGTDTAAIGEAIRRLAASSAPAAETRLDLALRDGRRIEARIGRGSARHVICIFAPIPAARASLPAARGQLTAPLADDQRSGTRKRVGA